MNKNMLAVALAALLVGGVAVAAYDSFSGNDASQTARLDSNGDALVANLAGDFDTDTGINPEGRLEYAGVVKVDPILEKQELYANVIGTDPIRETSTTSTPRQVCEDVVVHDRAPERDGNVGGTVAGALIGGVLGNQVGGGNGKKVATAAGAVAGGFVGNRVDRNHVGGQVTQRIDTRCRTVSDTSKSTKVVGYDVTYRNADGTTGTMRTGSKPGQSVSLGNQDHVVAYNVTYRYQGQDQTVRLSEEPGKRLAVIDGEVVTQTASAQASADHG